MKVTDQLKDYSYRNICADCFKEKTFITKYLRFFFYCTICLSVTSLYHTSEERKHLLEYDSKEESLKFHFFTCLVIVSCSYSQIKKVVIQAIFKFFGLVTATSFVFLR